MDLRAGSGRLESARPHLCGEDRYSASLELGDGGAVVLRWSVEGPRKDQGIVRRYEPARAGAEIS